MAAWPGLSLRLGLRPYFAAGSIFEAGLRLWFSSQRRPSPTCVQICCISIQNPTPVTILKIPLPTVMYTTHNPNFSFPSTPGSTRAQHSFHSLIAAPPPKSRAPTTLPSYAMLSDIAWPPSFSSPMGSPAWVVASPRVVVVLLVQLHRCLRRPVHGSA